MVESSSSFWVAIASGAAFGAALVFSRALSRSTHRLRLLDHPNSRSLHLKSVPRTGGLAIVVSVVIGILIHWIAITGFASRAGLFLGMGLAPLAVISLLDDYRTIAAQWRILVHLWAAVSLLATGFTPDSLHLPGLALPVPGWAALPLALLFTVWMINLYNFMDGMDGFAGGMAVIGFATLAWLGRSDAGFAAICLIVAAASAGFLVYNFPPARIFLGDVGSTTLGFLAATCSLWGSKMGLFPLWIAWLTFSPFIVDATVTLLRRLLRGEKVWEAHRSHYYQRLVLLGWGHRRTVLVEYALMLACAGSALVAVPLSPTAQVMLALVWVLIYSLLIWGVGWLELRRATVVTP
jgi:UDP-N-acetylmuramyl pentapeptide phosphotransferase/UDP-N-acetylglucosamine-1-phosphate transferase